MPITGPTPPPSPQQQPITSKPLAPKPPVSTPPSAVQPSTAKPAAFLKRTVANKNLQQLKQLSSSNQQESITQTIWKKGVVQTGNQPRLNLLNKHAAPTTGPNPESELEAPIKTKKAENAEEENESEETSSSEKSEERSGVQQLESLTQEKPLEPNPENVSEKERDKERENEGQKEGQKEGGKDQQQSKEQERGQQRPHPEEYEEAESHSETPTETLPGYNKTAIFESSKPEPGPLRVETAKHDPNYQVTSDSDGLPLDEPNSENHVEYERTGTTTEAPKPAHFDASTHPQVVRNLVSLTVNPVKGDYQQKERLDPYKKTGEVHSHASGVESQLERAFVSHKEETLFFSSQITQVLNRVNIHDGVASTTLLKQYEDLGKQATKLEGRLTLPEVLRDKTLVQSLQTELKQIQAKQTAFHKAFVPLGKAWSHHQNLVQTHAPANKIEAAKQALGKAEKQLLPQLEKMLGQAGPMVADTQPGLSGAMMKKGAKPFNRLIFVMSPSGEIYSMDQTKRDLTLPDGHTVISDAKIHHTTLLNGENVSGGGELRIGSQLPDLQKEFVIAPTTPYMSHEERQTAFGTTAFNQANVPLDLQKFNQQLNKTAQTQVERRFIEQFKADRLPELNQQIEKAESNPSRSPEQESQLQNLKQARTDLINEVFAKDPQQSPLSGLTGKLQTQFAKSKAQDLGAFKQAVLPQILHNLLEAQFPKGQIEILSDQSGHYQPNLHQTGQTLRSLQSKGVELEKLTVSLGSKGVGQEELRLPATAVKAFADFGHSETDLRQHDASKQKLHQELQQKVATPAPDRLDVETRELNLNLSQLQSRMAAVTTVINETQTALDNGQHLPENDKKALLQILQEAKSDMRLLEKQIKQVSDAT